MTTDRRITAQDLANALFKASVRMRDAEELPGITDEYRRGLHAARDLLSEEMQVMPVQVKIPLREAIARVGTEPGKVTSPGPLNRKSAIGDRQ